MLLLYVALFPLECRTKLSTAKAGKKDAFYLILSKSKDLWFLPGVDVNFPDKTLQRKDNTRLNARDAKCLEKMIK
jgi:hypothetical protein